MALPVIIGAAVVVGFFAALANAFSFPPENPLTPKPYVSRITGDEIAFLCLMSVVGVVGFFITVGDGNAVWIALFLGLSVLPAGGIAWLLDDDRRRRLRHDQKERERIARLKRVIARYGGDAITAAYSNPHDDELAAAALYQAYRQEKLLKSKTGIYIMETDTLSKHLLGNNR